MRFLDDQWSPDHTDRISTNQYGAGGIRGLLEHLLIENALRDCCATAARLLREPPYDKIARLGIEGAARPWGWPPEPGELPVAVKFQPLLSGVHSTYRRAHGPECVPFGYPQKLWITLSITRSPPGVQASGRRDAFLISRQPVPPGIGKAAIPFFC